LSSHLGQQRTQTNHFGAVLSGIFIIRLLAARI
jgi:hypothetical protein